MSSFAARIIAWQARHGRNDLPWQQPRTSYRVWVSEIMLQQTQVQTVIDYFQTFMDRFPTLHDLAAAHLDDVLALWSGLGYYSRARNLHRAARFCVDRHGGQLPESIDGLIELPGIGRSTAGAIISQALNRPAPILDGNAKRVLARHDLVEGWPGQSPVNRALWAVAESYLPQDRAADYTQGLMDVGALLCRRRQPDCGACPVMQTCRARALNRIDAIPAPRPRKTIPERQTYLVVELDEAGGVALERRPESGIWGGLYSLPERVDMPLAALATARPIRHTFSHFKLVATPVLVPSRRAIADHDRRVVDLNTALSLGLPQPIRRFLSQLNEREIKWQEMLNV